jgi:hypothetical protein
MTVYKKLQAARHELSKANLKKSGLNSFGGWKYYELGDFIPTVNKIFDEKGLCGVFSFGEVATLTIFDSETGDGVAFSTPIVYAESNKGQPIQLLGSTHSYLRRYLWLMAMEIVESDAVDAEKQEEKPEPVKVKVKPPAKIAGADNPWQLSITTDESAGLQDWLNIVVEATRMALRQAKSEKDVLDIFKVNRVIFDRLKAESEEDHVAILGDFKKRKDELKEESNGTVP